MLPQGSSLEEILSHAAPQVLRLLDMEGQGHSLVGADAVWARAVAQLRERAHRASAATSDNGADITRGREAASGAGASFDVPPFEPVNGTRLPVETLSGC